MNTLRFNVVKNAFVAALAVAGCSSSSPNYTSTLSLAFDPMYSGFDGVHTYQVPVTITGNADGAITWSASDPSMVDLVPDSTGMNCMITTKKAGNVTIQATTKDSIGKAPLTIESFTAAQWTKGQSRYTTGAMVTLGGGIRGGGGPDACTSCHGTSAVEHTPQQTGGFTDQQLKDIFEKGTLPPQDAINPFFGGAAHFAMFHLWTVADDDEATGLVAYLRSLAPMAQGSIDFGGHGPGGGGDGGRPDGFVPRMHDMSTHD
jgi:hypothetical protein